MEKFYEELPNKLREFGLSQKDFGRMIGVGQSTISCYTTGKVVPSAIVDKMIKTTVKELEKKETINEELEKLVSERKKAADFLTKTFLNNNEYSEFIKDFIEKEIEKSVKARYELGRK